MLDLIGAMNRRVLAMQIFALAGPSWFTFLDHVPFWNARDLERKLLNFKGHYNCRRAHCIPKTYGHFQVVVIIVLTGDARGHIFLTDHNQAGLVPAIIRQR